MDIRDGQFVTFTDTYIGALRGEMERAAGRPLEVIYSGSDMTDVCLGTPDDLGIHPIKPNTTGTPLAARCASGEYRGYRFCWWANAHSVQLSNVLDE